MPWKLPVFVDPHYGPTDRIYIYDADQRPVCRFNPSGDTDADRELAHQVMHHINESAEDITDGHASRNTA